MLKQITQEETNRRYIRERTATAARFARNAAGSLLKLDF